MRSQELENRLSSLMGQDSPAIKESSSLAHLGQIQNEKEKEKKRYLILIKLLASQIEFLEQCVSITPNKSLAEKLLDELKTLFQLALPGLKKHFPDVSPESLKEQNFYRSPNSKITLEDRDKILLDEMRIKCEITEKLATNKSKQNDPNRELLHKITSEVKSSVKTEGSFSTSKDFVKKASQHFTSLAHPLIKFLHSSFVDSLGNAAGTNAKFDALDQAEASDIVANANPFIAEETSRFRSQFGTFWGFLKPEDLTHFNSALGKIEDLKNQPDATQAVSKHIRNQMKSLSWGAKHLTRAASLLQKSYSLILKAYVLAPELKTEQLTQLAGFFLELPFSNKDWGLAYAILRRNFSKLTYESKLKVIRAATLREDKKEDPSKIITNLIWQTYASNPGGYSTSKNIGLDQEVSLQELNIQHYNIIVAQVPPETQRDYLSDLEELFDYKNNAQPKLQTELKESEISVQAFSNKKNILTDNLDKITTFKESLNLEFEACAQKFHIELTGNTLEDRLNALEKRYANLANDAFSTDEKNTLYALIEKATLTLVLEKDRNDISQDPALSTFYSELLRGLTITLGAHRAIASGKVERRHVPTVYAGAFFGQLSSLLSMPIVSGVLSGVGKAIEFAGSFKLKHNAETLSKLTTTNSQLELLVEKITILLSKHLETELKKYEPESVERIARFCQERCVALILIHAGSDDWRDLDKAAEKYFKLVTAPITERESGIEKVKMLFHSIKTLGVFRLKTRDKSQTRKTIAEVVTGTPHKTAKNNRKASRVESQTPAQSPPLKASAILKPTAGIQAQDQKLTQMQETIDRQVEKLGQLSDRVNALEAEKDRIEKEAASQKAKIAGLETKTQELAVQNKALSQLTQDSLTEIQKENLSLKRQLAVYAEKEVKRAEQKLRDKRAAAQHLSPSDKFQTPMKEQGTSSLSSSPIENQASKNPLENFAASVLKTRNSQNHCYTPFRRQESADSSLDESMPSQVIARSLEVELSAEASGPEENQNNPQLQTEQSNQNKHLVTLVRTFNELLESEIKLCDFLTSLSTNFNDPKNEGLHEKLKKAINLEDYKNIHGKMEIVRKIANNPFSEIAAIKISKDQSDKDLLSIFEKKLDALLSIINSKNMAERGIDLFNLTSDFKEVSNFINGNDCKETFDAFTIPTLRQGFTAVYIMPTQRIMRYKSLFEAMHDAIKKYTDAPSNIREKIQRGLNSCLILANAGNAFQPQTDYQLKLMVPDARQSVGTIYLASDKGVLTYTIVNTTGSSPFVGTISSEDLTQLNTCLPEFEERCKSADVKLKEMERTLQELEFKLPQSERQQQLAKINPKNLSARLQNLIRRYSSVSKHPACPKDLREQLENLKSEIKDEEILRPITHLYREILAITTQRDHTPPLEKVSPESATSYFLRKIGVFSENPRLLTRTLSMSELPHAKGPTYGPNRDDE